MEKMFLAVILFLGSVAVSGDSLAGDTTVTCVATANYNKATTQTENLVVTHDTWIEGGPSKTITFGSRSLVMSTNSSAFSLVMWEGDSKTGQPVFHGDYTTFAPGNKYGEVTGSLTFYSWNPTKQVIQVNCHSSM